MDAAITDAIHRDRLELIKVGDQLRDKALLDKFLPQHDADIIARFVGKFDRYAVRRCATHGIYIHSRQHAGPECPYSECQAHTVAIPHPVAYLSAVGYDLQPATT